MGLANTIIIIAIFTLVSINQFMNFYVGGFFIAIGSLLLYRVYKRRGMVSAGAPEKLSLFEDFDESESLLRESEGPAYKGGVGSEILHLPMRYTDSHITPKEWNEIMNFSIKQAEYAMSICKILSGLLCLTLEKHNFKTFDDHHKVPIYMIIGSSMSFVITYTTFDLLEFIKLGLHHIVYRRTAATYRPAILTNLLYLFMMFSSCMMGGGLGIVYGIADIEGLFAESIKMVYFETFSEIMSLTPIGLIIGLFFGMIFGILRALELRFAPELPAESSQDKGESQ